MLDSGTMVEFDIKKAFKHIRSLGQGGTGDAHLFKDETTDMYFAFKKYSPKDADYLEEYYKRFVDEIKILFKLYHPNIVQVYNYYLYPEFKTGYLQMEYIDGVSIDDFEPSLREKSWEDIFTDTILAFEYLEYNNILHRDIRPANIMVDEQGNVKVIDFGFGKILESKNQEGKSVILNWPVTYLPNEITNDGLYNQQTEVYFVGKLFDNIIREKSIDFEFQYIIDKMIKLMPEERYKSFNEISIDISLGVIGEVNFSDEIKEVYREFVDFLSNIINYYTDYYKPVNDLKVISSRLASLIRNSSLEEYVQDNKQLINCFINGSYSYNTGIRIKVSNVKSFYKMLKRLDFQKQKIVFDNINTRLSNIKVEIDMEDLPF